MLIFVLQTIWLYISELAGKDLDFLIIGKFLLYFSPKLIPLVLPLTILLASIMVFGSFAENYEFAAMKSTGISLQRAMRGLSVFIIGLAITTFFFANNVIPWAEFKSFNLRQNIKKLKPAMIIAEGQFNQIGEDFNIKVEQKSGDRGQYLEHVIIHKKTAGRSGNYTVIASKTGELVSSEHSSILQLVLYDGNYYDEIFNRNPKERSKKPHVKSTFEKYIINVDLEAINKRDLDETKSSSRYNMLGVVDLNYTIDSLYNNKTNDLEHFSNTLYNRTAFANLNQNIDPIRDSVYSGNVLDMFDTNNKVQLINLALNTVNSTHQIIQTNDKTIVKKIKWLNKHVISLHEKFVLGFACIILFFVGAPLGALIRKGGVGLPMIVAILLFLTYHFIGIFAKNSSHDDSLNPVFATWLSTLIMLPLSIYLTRRATKDRGLFEFDNLLNPLKKLVLKSKRLGSNSEIFQEFEYFSTFENGKLISILKGSDASNYSKQAKFVAYQTLVNKGFSLDDLETKGVAISDKHKNLQQVAKDTKDYALTAVLSYCIAAILVLLHFIFNNNNFPQMADSALDLSFIALLFFVIYVIVSSVQISKFNKIAVGDDKKINPFLLLIGIPFYAVTYFLIKNKIKEELGKSAIENIK
ncbi:permease [Flavobacteriales bacterium 34_180_T64]|nr:permease [Flavobacteriales bacterium 34_180_T64]